MPSEHAIERYTPAAGTELAAMLVTTGLLELVNVALHPHGLALGVSLDGNGRVLSIDLHEDSDPRGIWFDEAATLELRRRLERAGLIRRSRTVAGRDATEPRGRSSPRHSVRAEADR